ncbi:MULTISPECIES: MATE family efflux transporter [Metabacillus]|uniref:MATE family efflux transporter n=2 Tax=Metabacillus TaxID=2675233 RepID=A0A179T7V6_9BACI|nr:MULTISPECIES: MATE family efflux transporter [Metabacillus]OAS89318.1 MATE family efflux transporter [Metabacillus litoralis]QNF28832.1 MATE family efflux transporter [Metabacillus sp. KUDC1714]
MNQQDFTNGKIVKQIWFFSLPIMLTNLLQVSYQFIDSLWVGNLLGANALGAIAVSSTVIFTILSFIIGINNATLTILSQQKGQGNESGLKSYINAFVVILTILSVLLGIIGYIFSEMIVELLGTPQSMIKEATAYLQINFIGILFLFGYNFIGTVLRALGDSKTPIRYVVIAVILNALLDPIYLFVFKLGIEGAAYATILSQGIAFLYGIFDTMKRTLIPFILPKLPKKDEVVTILKLGIPSGLQMTVISAGVMAIMSVVNSFGNDVVAGFGAAQRLDSVIMLPAMALGTAVNSMAGQNIGANKMDRVHQIAKYGVLINLFIMVFISILVVIFAEIAIRLFINEEAAVQFGMRYLQIIALFYPFLGINFILNGIVRAAGAMFQVLVLNVISFWILRYPLSFLCSVWLGENGVAVGMGLSFVISSVIAYGYYKFGKWDKIKVSKVL